MITVKKPDKRYWCTACDEDYAVVEIGCNGSFQPFWQCGAADGEICLCRRCYDELKRKVLNTTRRKTHSASGKRKVKQSASRAAGKRQEGI